MNKKAEIKNRIDLINRGEVPEGYKKVHGYIIPNDWQVTRFNKIFERITQKNDVGCENVLTISAQYGLINQQEFFKKSIASTDTSNYFLLNKNDFAYNKSYSAGYPFGTIKKMKLYEQGIVSPLYICFRAKSKLMDIDYIEQYFDANKFNPEILAIAQEGARNHGLLNMRIEDFFNCNIVKPSQQEQEKIAKILNCCDKVIALKQKLLEEYSTEKLFLLHKFFSFDSNNKIAIKNQVKFLKSRNLPKDKIIQKGKYLCIHYGQLFRVYKEQINHVISTTNFDIGYIKSRKGDVLMPTSDVTPNGLATASCININNVLIGGDILIIRPNKNILGSFLSYLINYDKKQILKLVNGVTVYHIYATDMRNFKIPIFSIEKQKQIVQILSKVDKHIELLEQELEQYKQLKKSLSQLLLTGIVRTVEVDCEN